MRKIILALACSVLSLHVGAAEYRWHYKSNVTYPGFPTPLEACDDAAKRQSPNRVGYLGNATTGPAGQPAFECYVRYANGSSGKGDNVIRYGDNCPPDQVYNAATGKCVPPEADPCESEAGQIAYHTYSFKGIGPDGNPATDPPVSLCRSNCQYSHTYEGYKDCDRDFGPPDTIKCDFKYKGNGMSCSASASDPSVFDQPPIRPPVTNPPEFSSNNDCSDWQTQSDGTLKRTCSSNSSFKDEGDVDCEGGGAGSSFSSSINCTPSKNKPPRKSETKVDKETTIKENADGSSETTTKTDTTNTDCKGLKPCTSTNKSETEKEEKDANGNTNNTSGNCKGDGCNPKKPEGDGEEDKDGDEDGEEEDEEDKGKVSGDDCSASLTCEGDVIQCAILRKQKEQACAWNYDDAKGDIESAVAGEGYQLGEGSISLGNSFSDGANESRWLSASCPSPKSFSVFGHSYSISWGPVCTFASSLSFIIVALAGLFFAVYVGRGLGGQ